MRLIKKLLMQNEAQKQKTVRYDCLSALNKMIYKFICKILQITQSGVMSSTNSHVNFTAVKQN